MIPCFVYSKRIELKFKSFVELQDRRKIMAKLVSRGFRFLFPGQHDVYWETAQGNKYESFRKGGKKPSSKLNSTKPEFLPGFETLIWWETWTHLAANIVHHSDSPVSLLWIIKKMCHFSFKYLHWKNEFVICFHINIMWYMHCRTICIQHASLVTKNYLLSLEQVCFAQFLSV